MSEEKSLRELVNARLTAAAEEIFTLFERTIAGYKDELTRLKEENQRKLQVLNSILSPSIKLVKVDTHFPPGPDEPEEHHIKQEEEQPFTESTVVCIKREESPSPLQQRQTEPQEQTQREDFSSECDVKCEKSDDDKDWVNPLSSPDCSEFEDNEDHYLQNQIRKNMSVPETFTFENIGVMSGTDGGAECNNPQSVKIFNDNEGDNSKEHEQALCKNNNSNLQSQSENQTQERPFTCSVCTETYWTKRSFFAHKRQHVKEGSYSCLLCRKVFTRKTKLHEHNRIHTGEKPFNCKICDKSFRVNSVLQVHMRTHTGEKPLKCTLCDEAFSHRTSRNRHIQKHTGEKPFRCSLCKKSFTMKHDLTSHYRRHKSNKPNSLNE